MTTTKTKPIRKVKPMTEQTAKPSNQGLELTSESITLVKTDMPDVNVISMQDLMADFKKRMTINNHELRELGKDLRWVVDKAQPSVESAVDSLKGTYSKASSFVAKSYGTKVE